MKVILLFIFISSAFSQYLTTLSDEIRLYNEIQEKFDAARVPTHAELREGAYWKCDYIGKDFYHTFHKEFSFVDDSTLEDSHSLMMIRHGFFEFFDNEVFTLTDTEFMGSISETPMDFFPTRKKILSFKYHEETSEILSQIKVKFLRNGREKVRALGICEHR